MEACFLAEMKIVEQSIRDAGFIPYDQLYGYVMTGNDLYITRKNNARQIISKMDSEKIRRYLELYMSGNRKNME